MLAKTGSRLIQLCFRAHLNPVYQIGALNLDIKAHLFWKPVYTFPDALYVGAHYH